MSRTIGGVGGGGGGIRDLPASRAERRVGVPWLLLALALGLILNC